MAAEVLLAMMAMSRRSAKYVVNTLWTDDYWWLDFNDPDWWTISNTYHLMWNLLMTQGVVRPLWALDSMPSFPALNPVGLLLWAAGPALLVMSTIGGSESRSGSVASTTGSCSAICSPHMRWWRLLKSSS
jgi:hypothetical protein